MKPESIRVQMRQIHNLYVKSKHGFQMSLLFFHNACKKLLLGLLTGTKSLVNWESELGQVLLYIQNAFLLSLHYHDKPP